MKRDVLNKISRVINYEESERVRLNVYVDQLGDQQEEYLLIGEELILRLDNKIRKITFDEIKEINVSMCSRLYNPGIVESNLEKLIIMLILNRLKTHWLISKRELHCLIIMIIQMCFVMFQCQ